MTFICLMKKYNIMIYNFKKFNERLRISDLDENTASQIKNNLLLTILYLKKMQKNLFFGKNIIF